MAAVHLGDDPQAEKNKRRARAAETLEGVAERFLRRQEARLRPRSLEQVESHLQKHWAALTSLSIHEITRRNVAAHLAEIAAERGPYSANRARAMLSSLFTWAMKEGLVDANPVIGTNRQTDEEARDRVLADYELVAIWNACRDDDHGRIVRLLMATGQRRDEVGAMAKSEIDLKGRKWSIPSERTKNGRAHEVPLSDLAVSILTAALDRKGRGERNLIFGEAEASSFSGWSRAKSALDDRIDKALRAAPANAKPAPWRLHDLRRTAATRMADLGVQPHVIEAALNHVSGAKAGVAGIYNRALYSAEKRQALDLWAAHVEALLEGKSASNVVALKA